MLYNRLICQLSISPTNAALIQRTSNGSNVEMQFEVDLICERN